MKTGYAGARRGLQWVLVAGLWLSAPLLFAQAQPKSMVRPARTVLVMGDSLSAAYGLDAAQGWVALTAERIAKENPGWKVVNASISGETTAGGAARIVGEVVRHRPDVVVIELGANDGLRGLPVTEMKQNLARVVEAAQAKRLVVILAGMEAPPNYGSEYALAFRKAYRDLATQYNVPFVPFLLDRVAGEASLNQADGIHPNVRGAEIVADTVWTTLGPELARLADS